MDSEGSALEFWLSPTRDAEAAKRFFCKTLHYPTASASQDNRSGEPVTEACEQETYKASSPVPRVINVDKNAAYPKAIAELKAAKLLPQSVELRQVKYLNNLIEQDHRFIKRVVKPGLGFFSFVMAWKTLQGYEAMNMMRKGQLEGVAKRDIPVQVHFIQMIFGLIS